MRKFYASCLVLTFISLALPLFAAPPTIPASNVSFSIIDGGSVRINWTNGNGARRLVIARMGSPVSAVPSNGTDYLSNATFGSGFEIAPGEFVVARSTTTFADVSGLQPNITYYFAVYEYNGTGAATEYHTTAATGNTTTLTAPATQASNVSFTNVIGNSMRVNWTNGNGNRRVVIMKQGSTVDVNPVDLTNYTPSSFFGNGTQIGSGNYVVYNGTGTTNFVNVTNLQPNSIYHVAVFEANGNTTPVFLTTNPARGNQTTLPRPTVAASNLTTSLHDGTTMRLSWISGNGTRRIVVARAGLPVDAVPSDGVDYLSTATSSFNTAPEISPGQKVIYDNNGSQIDITGLNSATTYHFRVYEYDGTGSSIGYLTSSFGSGSGSTVSAPTLQASSVSFNNITASAMQVSWIHGNGSKRIVLAKAGSAVDAVPSDFTNYSPSSFFGSGSQIGTGNYVVYEGSGSSVNVTNLSLNVTYHFAVFEANGNTTPVFLATSPAAGSQTTSDRPSVAASNLSFSLIEGNSMRLTWTSGNGARRIVIAKAGSAVTATPTDGVDYLATATSPFNTAPEILPGEKVVYDNSGGQFDLSGLVSGTTYHFRIFEYNGTGSAIAYGYSFASGNSNTLSAPTTQASNISFTNVSGSSMTVNWVNGNGTRRIVVAKAGSPVDAVPSDYVNYSGSASFGNGSAITPGNYVIYNSIGATNHVNLTNLSPNTTYYFTIFEANGNTGPVYLMASPATGNQTTLAQPAVPASNLSFSLQDGNSMRLSWASGNGARRIIVARVSSPVDALPANGVDYLGSTTSPFSTAPEISTGQKVVYDGTGSQTDVTGLDPATTYHFRVYEYDGTGSSIGYLTSSFDSGSSSTVFAPTLQASTISFTSVTASSMVISWTNGNGAGRIVVMRQGSAVTNTPVDLVNYTPSTNFGSGNQIGVGNYVVFRASSSNITVNNLIPGTTYHVAIFEYNGNLAPMYSTPGLTGQATTIGPPAVQATSALASNVTTNSVQLNWTNGSGNRRMVLMKQGSTVDGAPANNVDYFANSYFGSGDQIGSGNYVVFDGIQDFVTVTNLQPGTTYHFAVFEYNDFGATSQVLTTNPARGNFTLAILPVQLVSFKGSAGHNHINLLWSTSQEQNSAYFCIQRSKNGVDFEEVGRVESKGESTTLYHYSFKDNSPYNGSNYYRLLQVDRDGRSAYSPIVHVKFNTTLLVRKMVNPVRTQLLIELFKAPSAKSYLAIYDVNGKILSKEKIAGMQITKDISSYPTGIYFLEIQIGSETEKLTLIKQ